ncbi:MAG: hypothetical protein ACYS1A_03055 [Planctomycetota bacterium]|jgi:hypothetical protein
MSQIDTDKNILSEEADGGSDGDNLKLVPVAESIRYRKRAQGAEKRNEVLAEQLARAESEAKKTAERLSDVQVEQSLMRKLAAAGVVDLETAVLVVKARMGDSEEADLDGVIEQLKKEKQYLFSSENNEVVTAQRTSGAKDRETGNQAAIERAAKKAATTGNRTDLQEYLKLRRNFL